jgi:hypothetical protein
MVCYSLAVPSLVNIQVSTKGLTQTQVRDIDQLVTRVRDAITTVDVGMLARTWQEIEYRLDNLRATNGAHVQLY